MQDMRQRYQSNLEVLHLLQSDELVFKYKLIAKEELLRQMLPIGFH